MRFVKEWWETRGRKMAHISYSIKNLGKYLRSELIKWDFWKELRYKQNLIKIKQWKFIIKNWGRDLAFLHANFLEGNVRNWRGLQGMLAPELILVKGFCWFQLVLHETSDFKIRDLLTTKHPFYQVRKVWLFWIWDFKIFIVYHEVGV